MDGLNAKFDLNDDATYIEREHEKIYYSNEDVLFIYLFYFIGRQQESQLPKQALEREQGMETGILQWLGAWTWVRLPIGGQELDGFETPANKRSYVASLSFYSDGDQRGKREE